MSSQSLSPPSQPIALRRSHLLAPAPDRLTNTPTTLSITRENTFSGRDFTVYQLRSHEPMTSPRYRSVLYTVAGRYWSNSQHREIRDAAGHPLLELRRVWWRKHWTVKRTGGASHDLLSGEVRWGLGVKISVRFDNALVGGPWEEFQSAYRAPASASRQPHADDPPPYSAVVAEHNRQNQAHALLSSGTESDTSPDEDNDGASIAKTECTLPTYESVRRNSHHSLRELLDAIEPPQEPAPAPAQRPRSEGAVDTDSKVELKVTEQSSVVTTVMMGTRMIIHIRRENVMNYSLTGPLPKWEVKIAEGVDLLLV